MTSCCEALPCTPPVGGATVIFTGAAWRGGEVAVRLVAVVVVFKRDLRKTMALVVLLPLGTGAASEAKESPRMTKMNECFIVKMKEKLVLRAPELLQDNMAHDLAFILLENLTSDAEPKITTFHDEHALLYLWGSICQR